MLRAVVCIVLALGAPAAPGQAGSGKWMDILFDYGTRYPSERPELALSAGLTMQWVRDPETHFPGNFARFRSSVVVVPPGRAMLLFPGREATNPYCQRMSDNNAGYRGCSRRFVLAVTQDGFWGVLDLTLASGQALLLREGDLRPIAQRNKDGESLAMVWLDTVPEHADAQAYPPPWLSRRMIVRVVEGSAGSDGPVEISFDSSLPAHTSYLDELRKTWRAQGVSADPGQMRLHVPGANLVTLDIEDLVVPPDLFPAWRDSTGPDARFDYLQLFERAFFDVRQASQRQIGIACDMVVKVGEVTGQSSSYGLRAEANGDLGLWGAIKLSLGGSAEWTRSHKLSVELSGEQRVLRSEVVWPFMIRPPAEDQPRIFAVGRASLCNKKREAHTAFLMTEDAPFPTYLHREVADLDKTTGLPPEPFEDPTEPVFAAIRPSPPMTLSRPGIRLRCFSQYRELREAMRQRYPDGLYPDYALDTLLATQQVFDGSANLRTFYGASCAPSGDRPAAPAAESPASRTPGHPAAMAHAAPPQSGSRDAQ